MKSKDVLILSKIQKYIEELYEFINAYSYDSFSQDKKTINNC